VTLRAERWSSRCIHCPIFTGGTRDFRRRDDVAVDVELFRCQPQRQSDQQPIPITSSLQVRLKGKPLSKGATIAQVLLTFDGEAAKSLKKPVYDDKTRTLSLNYPLSDYRVIMDLLRNETLYVQFLTYGNGHVWADLHTGTVRTR